MQGAMRLAGIFTLLLFGCEGIEEPLAETDAELGGRCTWRVKGRLQVYERDTTGEHRNRPLAGIDVRVYGSLINNGGFGIWGTPRTDAGGNYSFAKRKSCSRRNLKVQARFRNDKLSINEPGASDWMKIYETGAKRRAGTLDLGTRKFRAGGYGALGDWGNIDARCTGTGSTRSSTAWPPRDLGIGSTARFGCGTPPGRRASPGRMGSRARRTSTRTTTG